MKVGASNHAFSLRMMTPPNPSTIAISTVPRNSLIGWANACLVETLPVFFFTASVTWSKRDCILSSATKALMTRKPPSVSSSCDIVSLHNACACNDLFFNVLPRALMSQINAGATTIVNNVSCQLVTINVPM